MFFCFVIVVTHLTRYTASRCDAFLVTKQNNRVRVVHINPEMLYISGKENPAPAGTPGLLLAEKKGSHWVR